MNLVYEEKNCSRAIMRVGLPAMLGQLTTLIYNLADTFFVSLTKEPAMIAAVTLCAHYYVDCSRSLAALTRRWMRLLYFSW